MVTDVPCAFGPAVLGGLAELGPVEPFSGDLSLELGISLWLRRSGTSLVQARTQLLDIRRILLDAGGLDAATEPVPLVGRSPRNDVVNLVAYVADLLERARHAAGLDVAELMERIASELPGPAPEAVGA
jgi:hypothetical protein